MSKNNRGNSGGSWIMGLLIIAAVILAAVIWAPDVMNFLNDANINIDLSLVKADAQANNDSPINVVVNAAASDMGWARELTDVARQQLEVMQQRLGVDQAMLELEQARSLCEGIQRDTGFVFDVAAYLVGHDACATQ